MCPPVGPARGQARGPAPTRTSKVSLCFKLLHILCRSPVRILSAWAKAHPTRTVFPHSPSASWRFCARNEDPLLGSCFSVLRNRAGLKPAPTRDARLASVRCSASARFHGKSGVASCFRNYCLTMRARRGNVMIWHDPCESIRRTRSTTCSIAATSGASSSATTTTGRVSWSGWGDARSGSRSACTPTS
jgi:hypothetical protein